MFRVAGNACLQPMALVLQQHVCAKALHRFRLGHSGTWLVIHMLTQGSAPGSSLAVLPQQLLAALASSGQQQGRLPLGGLQLLLQLLDLAVGPCQRPIPGRNSSRQRAPLSLKIPADDDASSEPSELARHSSLSSVVAACAILVSHFRCLQSGIQISSLQDCPGTVPCFLRLQPSCMVRHCQSMWCTGNKWHKRSCAASCEGEHPPHPFSCASLSVLATECSDRHESGDLEAAVGSRLPEDHE